MRTPPREPNWNGTSNVTPSQAPPRMMSRSNHTSLSTPTCRITVRKPRTLRINSNNYTPSNPLLRQGINSKKRKKDNDSFATETSVVVKKFGVRLAKVSKF
ncbi:hypothetical protein TcWFU_005441 [Taenia crassiceps]|uniref:Uncharacterized protein n=1 Tax=Taenia crassiceps TaxID=6207 RepID=A0ABR4QKQ5_9CEST